MVHNESINFNYKCQISYVRQKEKLLILQSGRSARKISKVGAKQCNLMPIQP